MLGNRQSGMGLIEALIALLIISIGLLGIAALQITSLQQSSSANWHSQAVWYNYEMTDRINANRSGFVDADGIPDQALLAAAYDDIDTNNTYTQDCQADTCTPADMVTADGQEWGTLVSNLPAGRGFVSQDVNGLITVSVMWDDGAEASNCSNGEADRDKMTCFTVTMQ
ncbi:MAG: type IV pilus modification protein PilV [Gammaproteobacteria bacterium]|nr:type IV pilus modification protein PilV [Gammaproteobacteria bacterium]